MLAGSLHRPGNTTGTWKIGGTWAPTRSLRLRGSYQRAERVPNVNEMYWPQSLGQNFQLHDPCEGPDPARSFADCARTGGTEAQYGAIPGLSFSWVNMLGGGNAELEEETSDTYSVGVLYWPDFLEGTSLSIDWYQIEINDAISSPDAEFLLDTCLDTGSSDVCTLLNRDPDSGSLWEEGAYIDIRGQNIGYLRTRGYDVVLDAHSDAGRAGAFRLNNILAYVDEWLARQSSAADEFDCVGTYGRGCRFVPDVRNYLRLDWLSPWDITVSTLWRHFGKVESNTDLSRDVRAMDYIDLALTWDVTDSGRLRLGVNNLFDEEPPVVAGLAGNTHGGIYDVLGQYWFASIAWDFR